MFSRARKASRNQSPESRKDGLSASFNSFGLRKHIFRLLLLVVCLLAQLAAAKDIPGLKHEKLIGSEDILPVLDRGEPLVKVIVNLAEPCEIRKTMDWHSRTSLDGLHAEVHSRQKAVLEALSANEFRLRRQFENQAGFSAEVTAEGLSRLSNNPMVESIEPVHEFKLHLAQGIPLINGMVYRSTYNGQGVAIAICDTGIDYNHSKLGGGGFPNSKVIGGYDFGNNDSNPIPDGDAHGTCCAGIAAGDLGSVGDYIGGVAYGAKLYALKVEDSSGYIYDDYIISAWDWCVTHRNDDPSHPILVISNSFGGGRYFSAAGAESDQPSLVAAANNAVAAGITVLASAGNDGYCDSLAAPAAFSSVISVGAVYDAAFGALYPCVSSASCATKRSTTGCATGWYSIDATAPDKVTSYSNTASFLSILAPSNQAYTTDISGAGGYSSGDYYSSFGGTSAACPYTAGAVACLQSAAKATGGGYLSPSEVRTILTSTGNNITDGKVAVTIPRVNLGAAIDSLGLPTARTLTVTSTTGGTVTQPGAGTFAYSDGDVVNLVASASAGYHFANWTGTAFDAGKIASSTSAATTVLMDADYTVIANFARNEYTLTVNTVGSGSVTKSPNQATYHYGDVVQLTANSAAGWSFGTWDGGLGTTSPVTITIVGDRTITATFTQDMYTLTINTVGSGSVTKSPNQATYHYGDAVQLTANSAAGWSFGTWDGGLGTTSPVTITIVGNKTVTATFTQDMYTLNISTVGGGSVAKSPDKTTYAYGEVITVTATPNSGYTFVNWTENGSVVSSSAGYNFTLNGNRNLVANFTANIFTLTVDSSGASSVGIASSTGHNGVTPYNKMVFAGTSVNLQAPQYVGAWASRMSFTGWSGAVTDSNQSVTFSINGPKTVTVNYVSDPQIYTKFGSFDTQTNVKRTLKDCNSNDVTFSLSGGGYGEIDPCDCHFGRIELYGTTYKSVLTISTEGQTFTSIGSIIVNGSLKGIAAKTTDLGGNITVKGSLGVLTLNDVADDHTITIGAPSIMNPNAVATIVFDQVADLTINSQTPIRSLTATEWLGGAINTSSIGSIIIKGDARRELSGDLVEVDIILSQIPDVRTPALGKLSVSGWIDSSQILSQGNIGRVTAEAMIDSNCFAGVADGITGLPAAGRASFSERATIKRIAVKGIKGSSPPFFINSNIAAANIISASIVYPQSDNGGVPFGLVADNIRKLTIKKSDGTTALFRNLGKSTDSKTIAGVEIRLY
jgi:subtilisin family serine protease/predicted pyridoxine 5'-phosphate oxidase superfamily flavin-nucleotide-binding protein